VAERRDDLAVLVGCHQQAAQVGVLVEVRHGAVPAGQHHGLIGGDVDVGKHQRVRQLAVDLRQVVPEALCPLLATGGLGGQADLVHGGLPAAGGGDVDRVAGVGQGLV
jgi:hypothetical protein